MSPEPTQRVVHVGEMSHNARMHVGECHIMHVGDFLRLPCCTFPYCTCSPARENQRASYSNLLSNLPASPARETSVHALPRLDMSHDIHVIYT
jgi:hypothetical protein